MAASGAAHNSAWKLVLHEEWWAAEYIAYGGKHGYSAQRKTGRDVRGRVICDVKPICFAHGIGVFTRNEPDSHGATMPQTGLQTSYL